VHAEGQIGDTVIWLTKAYDDRLYSPQSSVVVKESEGHAGHRATLASSVLRLAFLMNARAQSDHSGVGRRRKSGPAGLQIAIHTARSSRNTEAPKNGPGSGPSGFDDTRVRRRPNAPNPGVQRAGAAVPSSTPKRRAERTVVRTVRPATRCRKIHSPVSHIDDHAARLSSDVIRVLRRGDPRRFDLRTRQHLDELTTRWPQRRWPAVVFGLAWHRRPRGQGAAVTGGVAKATLTVGSAVVMVTAAAVSADGSLSLASAWLFG